MTLVYLLLRIFFSLEIIFSLRIASRWDCSNIIIVIIHFIIIIVLIIIIILYYVFITIIIYLTLLLMDKFSYSITRSKLRYIDLLNCNWSLLILILEIILLLNLILWFLIWEELVRIINISLLLCFLKWRLFLLLCILINFIDLICISTRISMKITIMISG